MKHNKLVTLAKALKVSLQARSRLSMIVTIIGFVMAFLPSAFAITLQKLTDCMQALMTKDASVKDAILIFCILVGLFVVQSVFQFFQNYSQRVDSRISMYKFIRRKILHHKCEVKYKYIENYDQFNEKISFAETQSGKQVAESLQNMVRILQNSITFISITYLLFKVSPVIVVLLLITSIPAVILSYLQQDERYYNETKWIQENFLVLHYYMLCSGENALQEIRHYGLFHYLKKRWREFADIYCNKKKKLTEKHVKFNSVADLIRNIVYIIVLLLAAGEIYKDPMIGLGAFTLVFTLSGQMQDITASLFIGITRLLSNIHYMEDFFYLDTLERDVMDFEGPILDGGDIIFEDVNFTYPNTDKAVLENINVTIKEGEKVAIVGENGSGKTTFVSLLCGMFEPDSGKIQFGKVDIKEHMTKFRDSISVVFQDFGHYEDTLRNNITISDKCRSVSDEEIIELAKKTNIYDVIEAQPSGLDEQIGTFNAKSRDLSGGQWQKISIARAAYRKNAKIMILDEPTSALDPIAEAQLYRDFTNLTGNKTTVLISHRLGITSVVNRILVFKDGKIIEDGSHQELMNKNGYYTKMYQAQAQWYA